MSRQHAMVISHRDRRKPYVAPTDAEKRRHAAMRGIEEIEERRRLEEEFRI